MYEHSAITDQGKALLAACLAAGHALEFTSYVLGAGTYTDAEKTVASLKLRTALKDQRQTFSFTNATASGAEAILKVQVDNDGLDTGYYMREAGIYAKDATDNDATPILYQIGVDDTPSYMPDEDTPLSIDTECHTVIDNDASVTFTFTHGAYAWANDLGDIDELTTTHKDSAVDAINELDEDLGTLEDWFTEDGYLKVTHGGTQAGNSTDALTNIGGVRQHAFGRINYPEEVVLGIDAGSYFYHQGYFYKASEGPLAAEDVITPTGAGKNCDLRYMADEMTNKASLEGVNDYVEKGFKATRAYTLTDPLLKSKYIYIKQADAFYEILTDIANGENLTVGTNIKKTSVGEILTQLNSDLTNKINGTNGTGNSRVEFRNAANCASIIIPATTPSSVQPGMWIDINPSTKKVTIYANTGSGDAKVGTIDIV